MFHMAKGTLLMDVIKVKDLEMGRLAWIMQVGPIYSHGSLKTENFSWLQKTREMCGEKDLVCCCWL